MAPRRKSTKRSRSTRASKSANGDGKIRYGVVGLGHIAQAAVLPAFKHAEKNSVLAALISGNDEKLDKLGRRYDIAGRYSYEQLEECIERERLDAVYIALPNSMHNEFVLRAARCGAHILCEKPLGVSPDECREMYRAARKNNLYLMTAYRLHFDQGNMEVVRAIKSGKIGDAKIFSSVFSFQVAEGNIRLDKELGGGPLFDIGIYAINAARYIFQSEPTHVMGRMMRENDDRFTEVEAACSALLMFENNRVAQFTCSFATGDSSYFEVVGTKGKLCLDGAYEYAEGPELYIEVDEKVTRKKFKKHDQFSAELIYFSDCILNGREPEPSAREAEADLEIISAIRQSSRSGSLVPVNIQLQKRRPDERQIITRPPIRKEPELVAAVSPAHVQ